MHEITLSVHSGGWIRASCSCGRFNGEAREVTLDRLNGAVHEHIETEEAVIINRDAINDGRLGRDVGGEGYGTKSAITSEDELVDIETGLRRAYDPMLLPRGLHGPL